MLEEMKWPSVLPKFADGREDFFNHNPSIWNFVYYVQINID
ncbi:hypothetical protein T03_12810 [Trichinella britovi]|uniref:Uncharacterized protein n=1 Tax=Trichinella britovi TaxID=45882 RepID=A0A0V0YR31_TRIBR|nr:hypothetical protein T03_12810 [Trichinella britovi]